MRVRAFAIVSILALLVLTGCASPDAAEPTAFPAGAAADYQLGGGYEPASGVEVVFRDVTDSPADDLYSVCYVNGFQTQPGDDWPLELLVQQDGEAVVDPAWPDEHILDISTPENREAISSRIIALIDECAEKGFHAVEFDNLDTFDRFPDNLDQASAVTYATTLVTAAHDAGLAAGQKNAAEMTQLGHDEIGFDFAVTEECDQFDECASYTDVYGDAVVEVEYTDELRRPFAELCDDPDRAASVMLRDRDLVPADDPAHVYERC